METFIKYIKADVRNPIGNRRKLIIHCCNDIGKMGSGVALSLMHKWPIVKNRYMTWDKNSLKLGNIQGVQVEKDIAVINMVAQRDIKTLFGIPPIRYGALKKCLSKVAELAIKHKATVHLPYLMGCDRAGGEWEEVEKLIKNELCDKNICVIVYDLNNAREKK